MNTQNQSETLDFGEDPVTSVDAKLAILSFPYSWAEIVEQEEKLKNEILDFGENPVTSVEDKLEILAFAYNWADMVEQEEKLKIPAFPLVEESKGLCDLNEANFYKDTAEISFCPEQKEDSHPLQLQEKDCQNAAEANTNASPNKMEEAVYRIDNSVIQGTKRLVHIYDAKTGIGSGEIHAQYIPREFGQRDKQSRRTDCSATVSKELQSSYPQTNLLDGTPDKCSTNSGTTATCSTNCGTTATCSTDNRARKIRGMEIIDTEISFLSTEPELIAPDIQDSKSEDDAENEYFTKHPLMRLFLCGACCSKKRKTKTTEKVGLFRRIRKIFHRN